ncbi:uncharacterized protein BDV14DRAFT_200667 [Aspergillus stella-maris]|uniref:uncharacterized protein n=1 Tax=Aspergillus stella-maris TaxID=1810926 RepID=UPI003CCDBF99
MKYFNQLAAAFTFAALITASNGQAQPCYNHADPSNGVGNYCMCADGTCWLVSADTGCNPPSGAAPPSCPEIGKVGSFYTA